MKFRRFESYEKMTNHVIGLTHQFNVREGWSPADDLLPRRFHLEPLPESGQVITEEDLQVMLKDYYRLRGWE